MASLKTLVKYRKIPFLIFVTSIHATHLVGGDFRVTMINNGSSSSSYDIQLRLYRDDVNGAVGIPTQVTIGIYKIGTNVLQTTKTLYQVSSGDLLRNEIKKNTEIGKTIINDMNEGKFVSDLIVNKLIKNIIFDPQKKK